MESSAAPKPAFIGGIMILIVGGIVTFPIILLFISAVSFDTEKTKSQTDKKMNVVISSEVKYSKYINEAAAKYDISPALIAAVIKQESAFNPDVTSSKNAGGLMQLMPGTAKELGVKDRFDPKQNIMGGTKYLNKMLKRYDGNIPLALAAYNAGPGNVKNTIPPFPETQDYVRKVLGYYEDYKTKVKDGKLIVPKWNGKFGRPVPKNVPAGCDIGCYDGHTGQDFPGPLGTPIYAAGSGVVVKVQTPANNPKLGKNKSYGSYIDIKHDKDYTTRYAHMYPKDIKVKVGDQVKQGDVIASIGNMGNSSGAHLHFEVLKNGSPMNPMRVLK